MEYNEWMDKYYKGLKQEFLDLILDEDEFRDRFREYCLREYDRWLISRKGET